MVKFIDCTDKQIAFDDEIAVRCTCGAEILTFSFFKVPVEDKEVQTLATSLLTPVIKKPRKKILKSAAMMFPSDEAIQLFYQLLKGDINDGYGCIAALNGSLLGVSQSTDEDGNKNGELCFLGFASEKDFQKYNNAKNDKQAAKYVGWEIYLDNKGAKTFVAQFEKIFKKIYPDFKLNSEVEE